MIVRLLHLLLLAFIGGPFLLNRLHHLHQEWPDVFNPQGANLLTDLFMLCSALLLWVLTWVRPNHEHPSYTKKTTLASPNTLLLVALSVATLFLAHGASLDKVLTLHISVVLAGAISLVCLGPLSLWAAVDSLDTRLPQWLKMFLWVCPLLLAALTVLPFLSVEMFGSLALVSYRILYGVALTSLVLMVSSAFGLWNLAKHDLQFQFSQRLPLAVLFSLISLWCASSVKDGSALRMLLPMYAVALWLIPQLNMDHVFAFSRGLLLLSALVGAWRLENVQAPLWMMAHLALGFIFVPYPLKLFAQLSSSKRKLINANTTHEIFEALFSCFKNLSQCPSAELYDSRLQVYVQPSTELQWVPTNPLHSKDIEAALSAAPIPLSIHRSFGQPNHAAHLKTLREKAIASMKQQGHVLVWPLASSDELGTHVLGHFALPSGPPLPGLETFWKFQEHLGLAGNALSRLRTSQSAMRTLSPLYQSQQELLAEINIAKENLRHQANANRLSTKMQPWFHPQFTLPPDEAVTRCYDSIAPHRSSRMPHLFSFPLGGNVWTLMQGFAAHGPESSTTFSAFDLSDTDTAIHLFEKHGLETCFDSFVIMMNPECLHPSLHPQLHALITEGSFHTKSGRNITPTAKALLCVPPEKWNPWISHLQQLGIHTPRTSSYPELHDRKNAWLGLCLEAIALACQKHHVGPLGISPERVKEIERTEWPYDEQSLFQQIEHDVLACQGSQLLAHASRT